jgi:NADPH-dependent 2,4-dienoyl-CoA reductase/sulfur reductase-like enzyme
MENPILHPFVFVFNIIQWLLDKILSPTPPPPHAQLRRPKIAVIGAGLTGVSAAAHCVGHGFDVQIFEAGPRKNLGGIWSVSV